MWRVYSGFEHAAEEKKRSQEQSLLKFDQHTWYASDENRDKVLTYAELIGYGQMDPVEAD